jgi:hypothetical protein
MKWQSASEAQEEPSMPPQLKRPSDLTEKSRMVAGIVHLDTESIQVQPGSIAVDLELSFSGQRG